MKSRDPHLSTGDICHVLRIKRVDPKINSSRPGRPADPARTARTARFAQAIFPWRVGQ